MTTTAPKTFKPGKGEGLMKFQPPPPGGRPVRFLALFLLALMVGGALAASANVVINPRGDFPTTYFTPLTEDRAHDKLELYKALDHKADPIVFGASRGMYIDPLDLDGGNGTGFNFAISGGQLRDLRLLWDYVVRTQGAPEVAYVDVDVFGVRHPSGLFRSKIENSPSQREITGEEPAFRDLLARVKDSMEPGYFRDDLEVLKLTYVTGYPEPPIRLHPNGMQSWPYLEELHGSGQFDVEKAVDAHWNRTFSKFYDQDDPRWRVQEGQLDLLQDLMHDMQENGTTVFAFLPPFHPRAWELLDGNPLVPEFHGAVMARLLAECSPRLHVFDYGHVEAFNGTRNGFYDGFHTTPDNSLLMVRAMQRDQGNLCRES